MPTATGSLNPRVRLWLAVLADVEQRVHIAARIGLDLTQFRVTCNTCQRRGDLTPQQLLDHVEAHLAGARRVFA